MYKDLVCAMHNKVMIESLMVNLTENKFRKVKKKVS